jgi:hypothetical protein
MTPTALLDIGSPATVAVQAPISFNLRKSCYGMMRIVCAEARAGLPAPVTSEMLHPVFAISRD